MKTVFNNSEIAHVWANQSQEKGRNANGSFYFYGDYIYSYGSHFLIARHFTNVNGTVVLFSTRSYSNTTSKQISYTRQAIGYGTRLIFCYNPDGISHTQNFDQWYKDMDQFASLMLNSRKPEKYLNAIAGKFAQCKIYAEYFGLQIPSVIIALSELQSKSEYTELQEKRATLAKEAEAKRLALLKKDHKAALVKWRSFEYQRLNIHDGYDYLRFNATKNRIETSQAVEIPAAIAKEFYTYVIDTINKGGCIECNKQLLSYEVKEINSKFIIVGCHRITIAEIKKAIKLMA